MDITKSRSLDGLIDSPPNSPQTTRDAITPSPQNLKVAACESLNLPGSTPDSTKSERRSKRSLDKFLPSGRNSPVVCYNNKFNQHKHNISGKLTDYTRKSVKPINSLESDYAPGLNSNSKSFLGGQCPTSTKNLPPLGSFMGKSIIKSYPKSPGALKKSILAGAVEASTPTATPIATPPASPLFFEDSQRSKKKVSRRQSSTPSIQGRASSNTLVNGSTRTAKPASILTQNSNTQATDTGFNTGSISNNFTNSDWRNRNRETIDTLNDIDSANLDLRGQHARYSTNGDLNLLRQETINSITPLNAD